MKTEPTKNPTMTDILNADQVAELLECERLHVQELARAGKLPGLKLGRGWVFPREALLKRLNEMALQPPPRRPAPVATAVTPITPRGRGRPRTLPVLPALPGASA